MFAKKSLGQNFLMHPQIAERIVAAATLPPDALVLEIGPGTGMLTRVLLAHARKVIAIEADHTLVVGLEETFASEIGEGRLTLISGDVRSFAPDSVEGPYALVANIPYYLTGEIIRMFLSANHKPTSMTVLVQKEVAERIARTKKESILSLSVKVYGMPSYCFTVPRGAFRPAPNVDSAVLHIASISGKNFQTTEQEERFFSILKAGFGQKRKRLAKNLELVAAPSMILPAFEALELSPNARAEELSLASWLALSKKLS